MSKNAEAEKMLTKIKELVKKGNITKIFIKKNDEVVVSFPVNVGIVSGIIGFAATPWTLVLAAITTAGLGCVVELQKSDGTIVDINNKTVIKAGQKVVDIGSIIVEDIQDAIKEKKEEAEKIREEQKEQKEEQENKKND